MKNCKVKKNCKSPRLAPIYGARRYEQMGQNGALFQLLKEHSVHGLDYS
jgi:hypothetical protein